MGHPLSVAEATGPRSRHVRRTIPQIGERIAVDLLEQRHQRLGGVLDEATAALHVGIGGVAACARGCRSCACQASLPAPVGDSSRY